MNRSLLYSRIVILSTTFLAGCGMDSSDLASKTPRLAPRQQAAASMVLSQPESPYAGFSAGKPESVSFVHLLKFSGELTRATQRYVRRHQQLPAGLEALLDEQLIFHVPLQPSGEPYALTTLGAGDIVAPGAIGVAFLGENMEVSMRRPDDPEKPFHVKTPLGPLQQTAITDPGMAGDELLAAQQAHLASFADQLTAGQRESVGHQLLWDSNDLTEVRQKLLAASLRDRMNMYQTTWGGAPASWEALLAAEQVAPLGYDLEGLQVAPIPGRSLTLAMAGEDLMRLSVWTRLPGEDTSYVRYTGSGDSEDAKVLKRDTPGGGSIPAAGDFTPLLHAVLHPAD